MELGTRPRTILTRPAGPLSGLGGALVAVILPVTLAAQSVSLPDPASPAERIRQLMEASVEKQRQSISQSFEKSLETQRNSVAAQTATATRQYEITLEKQAPSFRNASTGFFQAPFPSTPRFDPPPIVFPQCTPLSRELLRSIAEREAERNGLDASLLWTVMRRESSFDPCAVSNKGAQGLMQLMPATAQDLDVDNPFDPDQNVAGGARYLRYLLDRYGGDLALALGAYHAGPGRVDEAGGVPPIPATRGYVNWILRALALPSAQSFTVD